MKEVTKKAIFAEESPVKRWLQERISAYLEDNPDSVEPPMQAIYQYCRKSDELVRAFWLATLCHESISQVAEEKEAKTYGKISRMALGMFECYTKAGRTSNISFLTFFLRHIVGRWESLLRQIRVCLLVSLRLHGIQLGPLPLTVHDIDEAEEFSPFQWLAYDELMMSHKHDEIISLESACRYSSHSFNASTPDADPPTSWKTLQTSCLAATLSADERTEYLVDFNDDDRLGALLLYLRRHNVAKILVAHRALLLAAKWGKYPEELEILEDSITALQAIDPEELKRVAYAVRLEIWQSRIRPVYRALMFGFDDVQEISPEVVSPLFQQVEWVKKFSEITSAVLEMLNQFEWHEAEILNLREEYLEVTGTGEVESWPALVECPILNKLIDKNKKIKITAFEAHRMLMAALKVTQDFAKLARCIPSFYDLFTPGSLFKKAIPLEDAEENQQALMQDAVVEFARNYNGPSMETLDLRDIEVLSDLFEFEMENIRTLFLLAMYEFGKDRLVDEMITRSASAISVVHFCDGGVEIICRRLNHLIHANPTEDMKGLMGALDANMCEWIKEKAENSESLIGQTNMSVPIGNTHLFALRLLSLGASADIDKKERIKIHSLIVLSGSIVKGLESLHPEYRSIARDASMGIPPTPERYRQSAGSLDSSQNYEEASEQQIISHGNGDGNLTIGEKEHRNGESNSSNDSGNIHEERNRDYYGYEQTGPYGYEPTEERNQYGYEQTGDADQYGYEPTDDANRYGYESTEEQDRYGYEPTEEQDRYGYEPTEQPSRYTHGESEVDGDSGEGSDKYEYENTDQQDRHIDNYYDYDRTEEPNSYMQRAGDVYQNDDSDSSHYRMEDDSIQSGS